MTIEHQYNAHAGHRLVVNEPAGRGGPASRSEGEWAFYQTYAQLRYRGKIYFAITDYRAGGILRADVVYRVEEF